jgi:hypothetical protein
MSAMLGMALIPYTAEELRRMSANVCETRCNNYVTEFYNAIMADVDKGYTTSILYVRNEDCRNYRSNTIHAYMFEPRDYVVRAITRLQAIFDGIRILRSNDMSNCSYNVYWGGPMV